MKKIFFLVALAIGMTASAAEYLVKYRNYEAMKSLMTMSMAPSSGMRIMGHHDRGSYFKVYIDRSQLVPTLMRLLTDKNVEWVVPNIKLKAFTTPVEANRLREQWAIAKVNAEKAWQRAGNKGSRNIVVAVIDTGVDYRHESLAPNMIPGYDFRENDNDPYDKTSVQNPGHGTHCAGAVGATGLVDNGIVGLSPEVSIMPIRFLGEDGSGDLDGGIKSIDYAIQKKAHVISASWGAAVPRSTAAPLLEAVKRADDAGVIFVAAAANDGRNNDVRDVFPTNANTPNMIAVAASGPSDTKPSWSNYGKAMVHLASPGENIISTLPNNKYGNLSGTSMATPLVSGLVAFLKSQDPSLTGAEVRALLQTTGAKVNIETACNCRVDAFAAVDHLLSKKPWLVPAAATIDENASLTIKMKNGRAPIQFTSSNPSVISVDNNGVVRAVGKGTAQITAKDADGVTVTSLDIHVGKSSGGGGGSCPIGDDMLCEIICRLKPDLPICK
ncbi:MAG: S8 family serine peptidase [Bdellovibrionaceae bacterium]|nr:S8 family serine peptidase [Pseudobdellovibrionaceae bacterium]